MREKNSEDCKPGPHEAPTAFLLAQVGAQAAMRFAERLSVIDLTPPQAGILFMLRVSDGLSQRFLAERLGVVPSRLVVLVDELEALSLIERRVDKSDRRTNAIHLTLAGREKVAKVGAISREHSDSLLAALSQSDQELLRALLSRIADCEGLTPGVHPGYKRLGIQDQPDLPSTDPCDG